MVKKKKVEAQTKVAELFTEAINAKVEEIKQPPQSDMCKMYRAIREKLEAQGLTVNDVNPCCTQVRVGKDFVDDCEAMIPAITGVWPEYPAWNFSAVIHAVVPKGDNTATRLEILKNVVRATLVGEPFTMEGLEKFMTSIIITDEKDSRAIGVRMCAISLLIRIERIKKIRR